MKFIEGKEFSHIQKKRDAFIINNNNNMTVPEYQYSKDGSLILHVENINRNEVEILNGATLASTVGRIKIPYKVNTTISAVSVVEPARNTSKVRLI
jgi:hypothetical protein